MSRIIGSLDFSNVDHLKKLSCDLEEDKHVWCDNRELGSLIIEKIDMLQKITKLQNQLKKAFEPLNECPTCLTVYYNMRENISNPYNNTILQNFDDERLLTLLKASSNLNMVTITEILTYNWKCLRIQETKFYFIRLLKCFHQKESLIFSKMTFSLILLLQCGDSELLGHIAKTFKYLNKQKLLFLHSGPEEWEYLMSCAHIEEKLIPSESLISKRVWFLSTLIYLTLDTTYYTDVISDYLLDIFQTTDDSNIKEMCFRICATFLHREPNKLEKFKKIYESIFNIINQQDDTANQGSIFLKDIEVVFINQFKNFCLLQLDEKVCEYLYHNEKYVQTLKKEIFKHYQNIKDIVKFCLGSYFNKIMISILQQPVLDVNEEKFVLHCIDKFVGYMYSVIRSNDIDLALSYTLFKKWNDIIENLRYYHNILTNFIFLFIYDIEPAIQKIENADKLIDIFTVFRKKIYEIFLQNSNKLNDEFVIYNHLIKSDFSAYNIQSIIFTENELRIFNKILKKIQIYFERFRIYPRCFSRILHLLQRTTFVSYDIFVELFNFIWYDKNVEDVLLTIIILLPKVKINRPIKETFLYNLEWIQILEKVEYKYSILLEDFFFAFHSWLRINNICSLSNHYKTRLKNFAGLYNILDIDEFFVPHNDSLNKKNNSFLRGFTEEEMKTLYEQNDANLEETKKLLETAKLAQQKNKSNKTFESQNNLNQQSSNINSIIQPKNDSFSSSFKNASNIQIPTEQLHVDSRIISHSVQSTDLSNCGQINAPIQKINNYNSNPPIVKKKESKNLRFFNPLNNTSNSTSLANLQQFNKEENHNHHQNLSTSEFLKSQIKNSISTKITDVKPMAKGILNPVEQTQQRVMSYLSQNTGYSNLILASRKKLEFVLAQHENEFTDEFFHWVLSFDYSQKFQFGSIERIPPIFSTFSDYEQIFAPLLLHESKKTLLQNMADIKSNTSKTAFLVEQISSANYFELTFKVEGSFPDLEILLFSFTDSTVPPHHKIFLDSNYFFGIVIDRKQTNETHIVVIAKNTIRKPILNSQIFFYDVCCFSSFYREYMALKNLQFSPHLSSVLVKDEGNKMALLNSTTILSELLIKECLNISQRNAISHVFMNCLYFSLIHGPPGTGKTQTIVSMIKMLFHPQITTLIRQKLSFNKNKPRVLICAPSNAAVDEIARRIIISSPKDQFHQKLNLIRIGVLNNINSNLKEHTLDNIIEKEMIAKRNLTKIQNFEYTHAEKMKRKFELLKESDVVCATLSSSARDLIKISNISFDVLIIDEACQCVETSALIPLKFNPLKVILIGDPKQLPPTVLSKNKPYEQSLFIRLMKTHPTVLLNTQYRMLPQIAEFPNHFFYENLLITDQSVIKRPNPYHQYLPPICLINIKYEDKIDSNHSFFNIGEASHIGFIIKILLENLKNIINQKKIGIITPYKAQQQKIRENLYKIRKDIFNFVTVSTVDGFQGKEMDIIIISAVKSKNIGFLNDERRINVSITRAKFALVIIGNVNVLAQSITWNSLINHLQKKKLIFNNYKQILDKK